MTVIMRWPNKQGGCKEGSIVLQISSKHLWSSSERLISIFDMGEFDLFFSLTHSDDFFHFCSKKSAIKYWEA